MAVKIKNNLSVTNVNAAYGNAAIVASLMKMSLEGGARAEAF